MADDQKNGMRGTGPSTASSASQPAVPHSIRRIGRIARQANARRYLEIGVNRGKTFNQVEFETKVAVDPRFQFDTTAFQREGVEFHQVTSDVYFTRHDYSRTFDLVFLDGLHTFQQTFRDFCNSLAVSHERTVWLIDDVLPVDVYSAWPNQIEAIKFRKKAGGEGGAWHGDVYKVMFAIHDFLPMYKYVTIRGGGNAQALVWKAPRAEFAPVFNSMEAIERLSYFDFLKRLEVLNVMSEEAAFETLFLSLNRSRERPMGNTR